MTAADRDILAAVEAGFQAKLPERLGIAVSGGGDSVALMHLVHHLVDPGTVTLAAATVDHGLRPDSAAEAEGVAAQAAALNIPHKMLRWEGWDGSGNLQARARNARYALLAEWARSEGLGAVVLGHTADDQAETLLMRLGRASGVDGLAGMQPRRVVDGVSFLRPLLGLTRAQLRAYLDRHDLGWIEDPSNEDPRFARVRARKALAGLADLGIDAGSLTQVAQNMAQARDALDWYTFTASRDLVEIDGGDVLIELRRFRTLPFEIARRLLIGAIGWIGDGEYAPRRAPMGEFVDAARRGRSATLGGCRMLRQGALIWLCREYSAVRGRPLDPGSHWDNRWRLVGEAPEGSEVRALGTGGLGQCPDWRASGRPWVSLIGSPALWQGEVLLAAPMAHKTGPCDFELLRDGEEFFSALLSH